MAGLVAHITPWGVRCGIAKHLSYWLAARQTGRPMTIIAETPPTWQGEAEDWLGLPCKRLWKRGAVDAVEQIKQGLIESGAAIAHWQWDPTFWPPEAIRQYGEWARQNGIQTVVTSHILMDVDPYVLANKALLRSTDQLVVGNARMATAWTEYATRFPIPVHRPVKVVPLAAPPAPAYAGPKGIPEPMILTWGMLGGGKDHLKIAEAVKIVRTMGYPNAHYYIVGKAITGEHWNQVAAIEKCGLANPGLLMLRNEWICDAEVYRLCQKATVIVLHHNWQHASSSGTIAISLASGTPVVVSQSPMFDGYQGAVFEAGPNSEDIARAIVRAIQYPDEIGAGRQAVLARINAQVVALEYEGIYASLEPSSEEGERIVAEVTSGQIAPTSAEVRAALILIREVLRNVKDKDATQDGILSIAERILAGK